MASMEMTPQPGHGSTVSGADAETMIKNFEAEKNRKRPKMKPMRSLRHLVTFRNAFKFDIDRLPEGSVA